MNNTDHSIGVHFNQETKRFIIHRVTRGELTQSMYISPREAKQLKSLLAGAIKELDSKKSRVP